MRRPPIFSLSLLVALAAALIPALARADIRPPGEGYALLIAVRQYEPSELRSLKFTEADVEALADALARAGYPRRNVRVMTQTRGAEQTRLLPTGANIRTELSLILKNMEPTDRVVVALAGHGVQLTGSEESYFCPADARLEDRSTLIPLAQVYAALEACGAGSKVLLVDACRNDPLTERARAAGRPVVELPSLTRPLKKRAAGGVAALFSCSGGERAYEDPELKHGVFFHFVIQGLGGEADFDRDGSVDMDELAAYTKRRVYRFVESEYRVEQTPELLGKGSLIDLARVGRAPGPDVASPKTKGPAMTKPDRTSRPAEPVEGKTLTNSIGMKLVLVPDGEFLMGSGDDDKDAERDEKPRHRVRITRAFYLGQTEVTVGQFRKVVELSGYRTEAERDGKGGYGWNEAKGKFEGLDLKYTWRNPGWEQTDEHPVVNVSWNDAIAFCNELSKLEGLKPYYQRDGKERSGSDGYRLPSEAEWEYACRSGTTTRFWSGDDPESLAKVGNVADATAKAKTSYFSRWTTIAARDGYVFTAPVGRFRPNAFGLYDMVGNVMEWCWDGYGYDLDYYRNSPVDDPSGPVAVPRVVRGGCWAYTPHNCRSADRAGFPPDLRNISKGFRIARVRSGG